MRKTYAILGIIFTIIIAAIGFSGYSEGTHYMTFLGIELSQTGFLVLILAFVVFDIFSVKNAFGADKMVETMRQESLTKTRDAQKLEGDPCTVTLTRLSSAVGAAMGVRVFLNGVEQEVLKDYHAKRFSAKRA